MARKKNQSKKKQNKSSNTTAAVSRMAQGSLGAAAAVAAAPLAVGAMTVENAIDNERRVAAEIEPVGAMEHALPPAADSSPEMAALLLAESAESHDGFTELELDFFRRADELYAPPADADSSLN